MKKCLFCKFRVQKFKFAQILEIFARTCVRVSVHFRSSGSGTVALLKLDVVEHIDTSPSTNYVHPFVNKSF